MIWYEMLLLIYITIMGVCQLGGTLAFMTDPTNVDLIGCLVNPVTIHQETKFSWFACLALTIVGNALFPVFAAGYWLYCILWLFYKLCTIGKSSKQKTLLYDDNSKELANRNVPKYHN